MWPETIVSGFLYLASFIFVVIRLLGLSDNELTGFFSTLPSLNTGLLGVVSALLLGGAYLFGHVAGRLMTDLFNILGNPWRKRQGRQNIVPDTDDKILVSLLRENPNGLAKTLQDRWIAKYFYRSMFGGVVLVSITSAPWMIFSPSPRVSCASWISGIILATAFFVAFWTQRKSHRSLNNAIHPSA